MSCVKLLLRGCSFIAHRLYEISESQENQDFVSDVSLKKDSSNE